MGGRQALRLLHAGTAGQACRLQLLLCALQHCREAWQEGAERAASCEDWGVARAGHGGRSAPMPLPLLRLAGGPHLESRCASCLHGMAAGRRSSAWRAATCQTAAAGRRHAEGGSRREATKCKAACRPPSSGHTAMQLERSRDGAGANGPAVCTRSKSLTAGNVWPSLHTAAPPPAAHAAAASAGKGQSQRASVGGRRWPLQRTGGAAAIPRPSLRSSATQGGRELGTARLQSSPRQANLSVPPAPASGARAGRLPLRSCALAAHPGWRRAAAAREPSWAQTC